MATLCVMQASSARPVPGAFCLPTTVITSANHHRFVQPFHPIHNISAGRKQKGLMIQATADTAAKPFATDSTQPAVSVLKEAAKDKSVPSSELLSAILSLEKAKLPMENLADVVGGNGRKGGKRWRLVFTSGKEQVSKGMKGEKAGGIYFPITAVQRWDTTNGEIENGTYFGVLAALKFNGPFEITGKKLGFTFNTLRLRLGPKWLDFPLSPGQLSTRKDGEDKRGPFFLFIYGDDDILVARGRGGGVALWAATSPSWELQNGIAA